MKLIEVLIAWAACWLIPTLALSPWTWRSLAWMAEDPPYWLAFVASIIWPLAFVGNVATEIARLLS